LVVFNIVVDKVIKIFCIVQELLYSFVLVMSKTAIPPKTKMMLWGKAAGRCQYDGCNEPLDLDLVTKAEMNASYIAHIYGDQPLGPRYHAELSVKLAKDISNLMLLCDRHHRLIDIEEEAVHTVEHLSAMKASHERRISIVTAITPEQQSHIILFGAKIGQHQAPLNYREAAAAMVPSRYPADTKAIELGMKNLSISDDTPGYWDLQEKQLLDMFERQVAPLKGNSPVQHFSVSALRLCPYWYASERCYQISTRQTFTSATGNRPDGNGARIQVSIASCFMSQPMTVISPC
jgi:hypothetical protein